MTSEAVRLDVWTRLSRRIAVDGGAVVPRRGQLPVKQRSGHFDRVTAPWRLAVSGW